MSLSRITSFAWENISSKISAAEAKKSLNALRGKANEIASNSSKFVKDPSPIDFSAYKNKLKFTASAVDALEATYKKRKLPTYQATVPPELTKKRVDTAAILKSTVAAAEADLKLINDTIQAFEAVRITKDTSVGELQHRFPQIARQVEQEIKGHLWNGPVAETADKHGH